MQCDVHSGRGFRLTRTRCKVGRPGVRVPDVRRMPLQVGPRRRRQDSIDADGRGCVRRTLSPDPSVRRFPHTKGTGNRPRTLLRITRSALRCSVRVPGPQFPAPPLQPFRTARAADKVHAKRHSRHSYSVVLCFRGRRIVGHGCVSASRPRVGSWLKPQYRHSDRYVRTMRFLAALCLCGATIEIVEFIVNTW